jgi:hypothetical protein
MQYDWQSLMALTVLLGRKVPVVVQVRLLYLQCVLCINVGLQAGGCCAAGHEGASGGAGATAW